MYRNIQITLVSALTANDPAIREFTNLGSCLSAQLRSQISLETRALRLEGAQPDFGVFVDGRLLDVRSLPELVDYLHLSAIQGRTDGSAA